MNNMSFSPSDGLLNVVSYPTVPASESEARAQVQAPLNQLRDFINNNIVSTLNAFETRSLTEKGYQKLSGGLIYEWGNVSVAVTANTPKGFTISLSHLPTNCFNLQLSIASKSANANSKCYVWSANLPTKTGASNCYAESETSETLLVHYLAIGN